MHEWQVAITMMALALCEDSIRLRARRDTIIDSLGTLPDKIREVQHGTYVHVCWTCLCGHGAWGVS